MAKILTIYQAPGLARVYPWQVASRTMLQVYVPAVLAGKRAVASGAGFDAEASDRA